MKPGLHTLGEREYHADPCPEPSLSSSLARTLITHSPLHAWTQHPKLNPDFEPEESAIFDRGKAAHALLLEGEDRMVVIDAEDYRKKEAQVQRDGARAEGKHPVLKAQYPAILRMREVALEKIAACRDFPFSAFADGQAEATAIWQEKNAWCRARFDKLAPDRRFIFDYKSTAASANPEAWVRTMLGMGGEMQGAFYLRGNAATGGPEDAKFVFIVQEVSPPFACCLIGLPPAFVALGADKVALAIAVWKDCMATNAWSCYPNRICWVDPPPWALSQWEGRTDPASGNAYDPGKLWTKPEKLGFDRENEPFEVSQ